MSSLYCRHERHKRSSQPGLLAILQNIARYSSKGETDRCEHELDTLERMYRTRPDTLEKAIGAFCHQNEDGFFSMTVNSVIIVGNELFGRWKHNGVLIQDLQERMAQFLKKRSNIGNYHHFDGMEEGWILPCLQFTFDLPIGDYIVKQSILRACQDYFRDDMRFEEWKYLVFNCNKWIGGCHNGNEFSKFIEKKLFDYGNDKIVKFVTENEQEWKNKFTNDSELKQIFNSLSECGLLYPFIELIEGFSSIDDGTWKHVNKAKEIFNDLCIKYSVYNFNELFSRQADAFEVFEQCTKSWILDRWCKISFSDWYGIELTYTEGKRKLLTEYDWIPHVSSKNIENKEVNTLIRLGLKYGLEYWKSSLSITRKTVDTIERYYPNKKSNVDINRCSVLKYYNFSLQENNNQLTRQCRNFLENDLTNEIECFEDWFIIVDIIPHYPCIALSKEHVTYLLDILLSNKYNSFVKRLVSNDYDIGNQSACVRYKMDEANRDLIKSHYYDRLYKCIDDNDTDDEDYRLFFWLVVSPLLTY